MDMKSKVTQAKETLQNKPVVKKRLSKEEENKLHAISDEARRFYGLYEGNKNSSQNQKSSSKTHAVEQSEYALKNFYNKHVLVLNEILYKCGIEQVMQSGFIVVKIQHFEILSILSNLNFIFCLL